MQFKRKIADLVISQESVAYFDSSCNSIVSVPDMLYYQPVTAMGLHSAAYFESLFFSSFVCLRHTPSVMTTLTFVILQLEMNLGSQFLLLAKPEKEGEQKRICALACPRCLASRAKRADQLSSADIYQEEVNDGIA